MHRSKQQAIDYLVGANEYSKNLQAPRDSQGLLRQQSIAAPVYRAHLIFQRPS
jgi:hypothetical protein